MEHLNQLLVLINLTAVYKETDSLPPSDLLLVKIQQGFRYEFALFASKLCRNCLLFIFFKKYNHSLVGSEWVHIMYLLKSKTKIAYKSVINQDQRLVINQKVFHLKLKI